MPRRKFLSRVDGNLATRPKETESPTCVSVVGILETNLETRITM